MADDGGWSAGVHRLRRRSHGLLGPRVGWRARKTMQEAAVAEIARRYWEMVCLLLLVLVAWGVRWASQYTACWMMTACSFPRRSPAQIPR
jgi:hypothetical protein